MPKFFIKNENIKNNKIYIVEDYNHIKNVLRKCIGDTIEICNINTQENYLCEILNIFEKEIECEIIKKIKNESEPNLKISIFQALPKQEKMELVIQKCIELGVHEFIPLEMKNCVVKLNEKDKQKKIQRWQKIAEAASKQSGRNIVPKVNNIENIKTLCNKINEFDSVIVAYEGEENYSIKEEIKYLKENIKQNKVAIVIGPEGGIEKEEIKKLKEAGAKIVTLGNRILRTETVALALTSIIMFELGDLN